MLISILTSSDKEFATKQYRWDLSCILSISSFETIKSKSNILMLHGELDPIVPPSSLLDAKDFLIRHKINIETLMIKNCDHHIPIEASSAALKFIKKNLIIK